MAVNIYERDSYYWLTSTFTSSMPTTVAVVEVDGKILNIVVPDGRGVECEDGHYVIILTEEEFNKLYSLEEYF